MSSFGAERTLLTLFRPLSPGVLLLTDAVHERETQVQQAYELFCDRLVLFVLALLRGERDRLRGPRGALWRHLPSEPHRSPPPRHVLFFSLSARMLSFDYTTGKTAAVSTTTVGGVARAYAFVPRAR